MTSNTALGDDLCPLEGRRTTTELVVKLFVVHFTTLTAYCHVLSIRGEPIMGWRLAFYVLEPFSLFGHYVVSAILVAAAGALYLVKPTQSHKEVVSYVAAILFGRISTEHERTLPQVASRPPRRAESRLTEDRVQPRWKGTGRMLLAVALLTQCVCTMVLYHRRRVHGAITFADQRVFELGCSSVLTALLWLAVLAKLPPFSTKKSLDAAYHGQQSFTHELEQAASFLRFCSGSGSQRSELLDMKPEEKRALFAMPFLANGAVACLSLLARGKLIARRDLLKMAMATWLWTPTTSGTSLADFGKGLAILGLIVCFLVTFGAVVATNGAHICAVLLLFPCFVVLIAVMLLASLFAAMALLLLIAGSIPVFVLSGISWASSSQQLGVLSVWPTNMACPLMWNDPAAAWLWALA